MILQREFKDKTVIITGHTGFKGAWLTAWLKQLGAKVVGIALEPPTDPSHFVAANLTNGMTDLRIDIRNQVDLEEAIVKENQCNFATLWRTNLGNMIWSS